jgi:hypothetical protein
VRVRVRACVCVRARKWMCVHGRVRAFARIEKKNEQKKQSMKRFDTYRSIKKKRQIAFFG